MTAAKDRCWNCGGDAGDNWFDRSICPSPCDSMHTRCVKCGVALDHCPFDGSVLAPDGSAEKPVAASVSGSREDRALNLLVQASRSNPTLREAVAEVEKWVARLKEDRSSAWQSYEEADREADWQMGAKLEAQQALWLLVQALGLNPAGLPAGWKAATPEILARIETIADEADRLAHERDRWKERTRHLLHTDPSEWEPEVIRWLAD